jgi:peptide/nickel transport system permease protein
MWRLVWRRAAMAVPLLLGISFVVYLLIALTPGDPAELLAGENPTPAKIAQVRESLGLDDPLLVRYWHWLSGALHGDLGKSLTTGQPVGHLIISKAGITASLVLVALVFTLVFGFLFGVLGALRSRGVLDRGTTVLGSLAVAVPVSWIALVLVMVLAVNHQIFPALGYAPLADGVVPWIQHLILPATALAILPAGELTLQLKSALQESLGQDYIVTARAKGLAGYSIVLKHALRNAAIPVVTVLGFRTAQLIGGTTVVEQVFNINGLGKTALNSTLARDVPVLLGVVMLSAVAIVVINLLVDISYGILDPKVRK